MIAIIAGISWALVIALLSVVAFMALLLLAGFLYQCIGGIIDCRRLRTRGRLVDIGNDRRLYLVEKGPRDRQPTVVFESGFGATSLNWAHIQEALAPHVHTVAYDRCGLGWSSACVSERTPTHVAAELRNLLHTAGIEPPYLLVGHSFGGLVMQRFALDYPEEAAGLILIDPMRTEEWPPVNEAAQARIARAQRLTRVGATCARLGLTRLAARSHLCGSARLSGFLIHLAGSQGEYLGSRLNTEIGKMPTGVRPAIAAHWSAPRFYRGLLAHLNAVPATVTEMHHVEPIRDTAVAVLTPAGAAPMEDMLAYGPNSCHIVAENSEHWIHLDEPALVVRTILEFAAAPANQHRERTVVAAR
ncbi:MAG TPA: alpha/beta hydrolase [Acidobacteriaceae bacterium]|jgi:pimeloyl-ACP methyl ester carboxylesterase|nr:alpha/beta hydrolase [Acidobacteriaceae bacterium]